MKPTIYTLFFPLFKATMHVKKVYSICLPAVPKFFLWRCLLFLALHFATLSSGVSGNIAFGKKSNIHFVNSGNKVLGIPILCHSQTVYQQCPIIYVCKTQLLVSQLLHITLLAHFSEQLMNLQFEAITTTNINFQILHCQVHCFEARLTLILG